MFKVNVPRLSYLPFLLPRLHAFFGPSLIDPTQSVTETWLEFQDLPLKWHYPVGLLYDLFSGAQPANASKRRARLRGGDHDDAARDQNQEGQEPDHLPWKLTVHYSQAPSDHLFQLDAEGKVLLDAYINSVKEADFLRNGSARTFMSLSKNDSSALWRAVETRRSLPTGRTICQ